MFLDRSSTTMNVAITGLRLQIIMLPLLCINIMGVAYYQSIARAKMSMSLSMLRQFILLIPLILILPNLWGLIGVWCAKPIADGIAVFITLYLLIKDRKNDEVEVALYAA